MELCEQTSELARPKRLREQTSEICRFSGGGSYSDDESGGSSIQDSFERFAAKGKKKKGGIPNKAGTRQMAYKSKGAFNTKKARTLFDDSDDEIKKRRQ